MNLKKLFLMLTFFVLLGTTAFAQTNWYVNNTNGIDNDGVYDGKSAAQPFKSLTYALGRAAVVSGDIINVAADTYNESGSQLNVVKDVSFVVYSFNSINTATITNGVKFNPGANKTVNFGATGGVFSIPATATSLWLNSGAVNTTTANLVLGSGALITRDGGSINAAPTFGANTSVTYQGGSDITSGFELPASLGTGTLTVNTPAKVTTISSALTMSVLTVTAGTANFNANATLTGDINNSGTVKLNSNQLTLSRSAVITYTKVGSIVTATAGTTGDGIVVLSGAGNITTDAVAGTMPNLSIPSTYTGVFTLGSNLTLDGNFTLGASQAGAISLGANTLSVRGNFNRTNNTPGNFAQGTGTLTFIGGAAQTFNPGASLVLNNLTVNKTAATTATMQASVEVKGNVTITSGNFDLSDYNVNMTGTTFPQVFNNSGSFYSTTGNGYLIWATTTDAGGVGTPGKVGEVKGGGTFGNMLVNLTADEADYVGTDGLGSTIKFSGVLYLQFGDFRVLAGDVMDFRSSTTPSIPNPTIKINTTAANGCAFVVSGTATYTADVNLYYFGTGTYTAIAEWTSNPTKLNDVTVATTGGNTITGFNGASTLSGTLTVNAGQVLDQGANIYTLDGASKTHSILGNVTNGTLNVVGDANAVNGTTSTVAGNTAEINSLTINPGTDKTFTSSNLKKINGNIVNTTGNSTVTMNPTTATLLGSTTLTAGSLNLTVAGTTTSDMTTGALQAITVNGGTMTLTRGGANFAVTGNVNVTAGKLVLGSNVTNNSSTTLSGGSLDLGTFTYTSVYDFNRTANASLVQGTGWLKLAYSANYNFTAGGTADLTIPNLEIVAGANTVIFTGGNNVIVSGELKHTSGTLDFAVAGKNINVAGPTYTYTAGTYTATGGTGALAFTSAGNTTATFAGNVTIPNVLLNSDGTITVASSTSTARTVTATNFTQTKGNIATGINTIVVPTTFSRTAGTWSQGTGYLNLGAAAPTLGTGFSVDNLRITAACTPAGTATFTVVKNLILQNSLTLGADNRLLLGDNVVIERQGNAFTLSHLPTFAATTNVVYGTYSGAVDITTAKELPAAVKNFTVQAGANKVILAKNVNVSGTLSLASMLDATTTASTAITMADNSTLELKANGTAVLDEDLTRAGLLNITYDGATATTTRELLSVTSGTYDNAANGVITFKSGTVLLSANLTLTGSFAFSGGTFDLNGKTLNLNGNVSSATTTTLISTVAGANIAFTGANNTSFGGNYVVPANIGITVNKTNADNTVTLTGNLNFATNSKVLTLTKGILVTGNNVVTLEQNVAAGMPTQGYARTSGWINGNVSKLLDATTANAAIRLTRVEFPVGAGDYKPMAFQFNTLPTANFTLTVKQVDASPAGVNGFPITSGSIQLANYPNFYWLVSSDLTLQPQVKYDIEAKAQGYAPSNYPEGVQNVRFLRRFDTNTDNPWVLQGGLGYDNSSYDYLATPTVTTDDGTAIIVRNAEGAISTQGARFTYSQAAKAPTVTTAASAVTVAENVALTVTWTKASQNLGGTATFDATPVWTATAPAVVPTNATFNASTGTLTWTPTYTQAGTYTIAVKATDGTLSTTNTVTITVTNSNQLPSFTATGAAVQTNATVPYGVAKTFTYIAKDADNETLTYAVNITPTPTNAATISNVMGSVGLFSWTPAFADLNNVFTVTVTATDPNAAVATTVATLTVSNAFKKGDATLSGGEPDVADAIQILKHVVGLITLTPEAQAVADVNGNSVIEAYDATLVLKYIANNYSWTGVSKTVATAGTVEFSRMNAENGVITLPLSIGGAMGINSFEAQANLNDANIEVGKVNVRLPEGWLYATTTENGIVKIAAAGTTPLTDGIFATVEIKLANKESVVSVQGNVKLNDDLSASLTAKVREIPTEFALSQNYPNPFNPTTSIKFSVAQDAKVSLVVYDMLGQRVRTLVDGVQEAGFYTVRWDGSNDFGGKVASGIYIYRLQAGNFVSTMKMNLMK